MRTRIPHLPQLIRSAAPTADLVPDRALLAEYVSAKNGIAFELLVRRHGPAVWAVCRRHLANTHDAEDAFQATFLVLAKSASRVSKHASVGSWLYGVAYRVALKARRSAARRKRIETAVTPADEPVTLPVFPTGDTAAIVHAELEKLPDRYRLPILLCDLEGLSRKEASAQLGWSEGTLSGRLNRARKLLAVRLTVRGIAAGVLATVGTATVPPAIALTTAVVGVGLTVIGTSTMAAPETVAAMAHGAMRDMTRSFVLKLSVGVLAASLLLTGGLIGVRVDGTPQATAAPVPKPEMAKPDDLTVALVELMSVPAVQRELKLSAESRVKLIDGFEQLEEDREKSGRNTPRFNERVPNVQSGVLSLELEAGRAKDFAGRRELVASVLTKAQLRRLQQCEIQILGPQGFQLKRVQDELTLTDDQQQKVVKEVRSALSRVGDLAIPVPVPGTVGEQGGGVFPGSGVVELGDRQTMADVATSNVVSALTPAQAKKWKELTGEKVGFNGRRVGDQCPAVYAQLGSEATRDAANDPLLPPNAVLPPAQPLPQKGAFPPAVNDLPPRLDPPKIPDSK
jgi:RNA polymerase sigma factor (sigma-70 family)